MSYHCGFVTVLGGTSQPVSPGHGVCGFQLVSLELVGSDRSGSWRCLCDQCPTKDGHHDHASPGLPDTTSLLPHGWWSETRGRRTCCGTSSVGGGGAQAGGDLPMPQPTTRKETQCFHLNNLSPQLSLYYVEEKPKPFPLHALQTTR